MTFFPCYTLYNNITTGKCVYYKYSSNSIVKVALNFFINESYIICWRFAHGYYCY